MYTENQLKELTPLLQKAMVEFATITFTRDPLRRIDFSTSYDSLAFAYDVQGTLEWEVLFRSHTAYQPLDTASAQYVYSLFCTVNKQTEALDEEVRPSPKVIENIKQQVIEAIPNLYKARRFGIIEFSGDELTFIVENKDGDHYYEFSLQLEETAEEYGEQEYTLIIKEDFNNELTTTVRQVLTAEDKFDLQPYIKNTGWKDEAEN